LKPGIEAERIPDRGPHTTPPSTQGLHQNIGTLAVTRRPAIHRGYLDAGNGARHEADEKRDFHSDPEETQFAATCRGTHLCERRVFAKTRESRELRACLKTQKTD
jgi:hypothetical protein